jgi:hypothetical protein
VHEDRAVHQSHDRQDLTIPATLLAIADEVIE